MLSALAFAASVCALPIAALVWAFRSVEVAARNEAKRIEERSDAADLRLADAVDESTEAIRDLTHRLRLLEEWRAERERGGPYR